MGSGALWSRRKNCRRRSVTTSRNALGTGYALILRGGRVNHILLNRRKLSRAACWTSLGLLYIYTGLLWTVCLRKRVVMSCFTILFLRLSTEAQKTTKKKKLGPSRTESETSNPSKTVNHYTSNARTLERPCLGSQHPEKNSFRHTVTYHQTPK
jgi:hypothetical protein